jgi:hypothetical protein
MPQYRFYVLDGAGHVSGPAEIVDCEDDQVAIERAREAVDERPIEVWEQSRVVAHLDPANPK